MSSGRLVISSHDIVAVIHFGPRGDVELLNSQSTLEPELDLHDMAVYEKQHTKSWPDIKAGSDEHYTGWVCHLYVGNGTQTLHSSRINISCHYRHRYQEMH